MNENNNRAELEMLTFGHSHIVFQRYHLGAFHVVCNIPVDFIFGCGFSF